MLLWHKLLLLAASCVALGLLRGFRGMLCASSFATLILLSSHLLNATTREDTSADEDEEKPQP